MTKVVKNCPLCGEREFHLFDQRKLHGFEVSNQICKHCGLVFQSPRMTEPELDNFYTKKYRHLYQGDEGPTQKDILTQKARANSLINFLAKANVAPSQCLDIGSSAGIFLKRLISTYACKVTGVEPGSAYQNYAQQQGIIVYSSLDDLAHSHNGQFDLVSMSHVLEHIPNPVEYLSNLRERYLTPDGWLLIEVPNLYAHDSFEIAHLISFSPHTLRETLKKAGFEIVENKKHGLPRSDLLPLYLTFLAQPRQEVSPMDQVKPEQRVALKRKLGMCHRRVLGHLKPHRTWSPLPKE